MKHLIRHIASRVVLSFSHGAWCGLASFAILAADAKPLPVPFQNEYHAENWGLDEGFPANSCSGIVMGPDGYLWLGTFRGLVRFNGQVFKPWTPAAAPNLGSTAILSMYRDGSGRIWFSTLDGLVTNQGGTWRKWTTVDGWDNPVDAVRSYAEDAAGQLVFTRSTGRVLRLEGDKFRELLRPEGVGGSLAALDGEGTLYIFRRPQVASFSNGGWKLLGDDPTLGARAVGVTQLRDGHVAIICPSEMFLARGGRIVSQIPLSRPVGAFWRASEDASGALWLSSLDSGVYRIQPDGTVRHFRKPDGLPHGGGTRAILPADDGSVWIGSAVGGLTRFRSTRFQYIGDEEGMGDREVLTVTTNHDGHPLFAPYGGGLKVFDGVGRVQPALVGSKLPLYCRAILRTRDGVIWLGTNGTGLYRVDATAAAPAATEFLEADQRESVHTLFEDSRGRLWVGGERNVLRREADTFHRIALPAPNRGRRPTVFAERRDGSVLIAQHHEIYVFGGNGLESAPLVRLPPEARISTLAVDEQDRIWIGTSGHGLSVFHEGTLGTLGVNRGLPGAAIASLVQDLQGQLWFGSGRSVVRANPDELWAATRPNGPEPRIVRFDGNDGIRNIDFVYGTQPNVLKDAQGRLWFAMIRGAAVIDPARLAISDRRPPVVVESISYVPEGARHSVAIPISPAGPAPVLPAGSRLIRIDYAALDIAAPRKQRFRVALDGEWQDLGNETTVSFLELPPGGHRIQVQAASGDDVWNRTGATLDFHVTAFFWQTTWFRSLLGLGALGLAVGGVWLATGRRTQVAREKLERERRLNEAQSRLALVLENTSDFVAFADAEGTLVYMNRAGRSLLGFETATDVRSVALSTILPRWAQQLHQNAALPAAVQEGTWSGESALLRRNGTSVPVSKVLIAHRADDGALDFISMIARDISTAKRQATVQDALRRLATALTAALEPPSLGRTVAEACQVLFGHDAFFLVLLDDAKNVTQTAYAEDTPADAPGPRPVSAPALDFTARLGLVLEGRPLLVNRDPATPQENPRVAQPWGETKRRSLSIMYAPIRWEGRTIGVVSLQSYTVGRYRDADLEQLETVANHCGAAVARLKAEALLRKREVQLRQTQKLEAVGTLAGGIAHDFNNILTAISCNAELAGYDLEAKHPSRDFIQKIQESSARARDLVRRILAFSRPQTTERQAVSAAAVVEEVVKLLRSTTPALVEISVHFEGTLPPADIDATELHQVLLNLGTNAAHAVGNSSGRIEFRVDTLEVAAPRIPAPNLKPGNYVRCVVRDDGCGIAPEILPRIFDPFFTTKGPGEGSGLGLSVAHGIIKARGGAITVASSVGEGTSFCLYLPVSPLGHSASPLPPGGTLPGPVVAKSARLLLVDDEEMIVLVLRTVFSRAGYSVASFSRPSEALAAFQQDPSGFDLVLTDLSMPEMTGITLAQSVRALCPEIPIVLISGYLRKPDQEAARAVAINEIVEKPVTAERLLPMVARLLTEKKAAIAQTPQS